MFTSGILLLGSLFGQNWAPPPSLVTPVDPFNLIRQGASSGCPIGQPSCHNTTSQDTCCFESPGGLLLQTQFWDAHPSTGPSDSWTIHGLWPDNCDGTFEQNCDPSRAYTDIAGLLTNAGATDTLADMNKLWVDINGDNEHFWEHEWGKHGTCMSTLEPPCLPPGSATGAEAVAFFNTVVRLFKTLPTYDWLAQQGITPSSSETFTLSQLTSALTTASGFTPALDCRSGALNAISWYFNIKGSVIDGTFVPIDAPKRGSCPSNGRIRYPPKSGSPRPTETKPSPGPPPTSLPGTLPGKAVITASNGIGGLLSTGKWSTQTLAKYTLSGTVSSFTMETSKGNCGVRRGVLACGSGVSASSFSAVSSDGQLLLAFAGATDFSSDRRPSGAVQQTVFTGRKHSQDYNLVINSN